MENTDHFVMKMFFDYMQTRSKKVVKNLQDGLSDQQINDISSQLDFALPNEVNLLYKNKNGVKDANGFRLQPDTLFENGIMLSLEESIGEYNAFFRNEPGCTKKLPLFQNISGDFLLIDCDETSKTYKQILIHAPGLQIIEPTTIYSSLSALLQTTIRCFVVKAYYYDKADNLITDYDKLYQEAKLINPKAEFWNQ